NVAMIGTQDNGTQIQSEAGSVVWIMINGGDGGDVAIDDTSIPNYSIRYGSSEFLTNDFFRATYDSANQPVSIEFPALRVTNGAAPLEARFVTPIKVNKVDPNRLLFGGANFIYESLDQGDTISGLISGPGLGFSLSGVAMAGGGRLAGLPNSDALYYGSGST